MTAESGTELRTLRSAEWDTWFDTLERAFGGAPKAPRIRALWRTLTEPERSLGAWAGDDCVGTAGAFSFGLSVPGGALVPAAGVTMVSVAATHRRRGLLTAMMRRQLDEVHRRGEPLAALIASEPDIYGRFGYGMAAYQLSAMIDTHRVRLSVPGGTDTVRIRYADPVASLDACEAVYARQVPQRPGMLARRPGWEGLAVVEADGSGHAGGVPLQCVLAERDGVTVGYARFRNRPEWDAAGPRGTVVLCDLEALDPAAHAALWRFLFDVDLTSWLSLPNRPADDAWQHLVSDIRRCQLRLRDALFVRVVDVPASLRARTYRTPVETVLQIEDSMCPWNDGRWRLTGGVDGAECARTGAAPEVVLSARDLGCAYLGGVSLTALASAGRVHELKPGALAQASAAFASDLAPWTPHAF
ncbi:GNAT family N-acetyltransferase [Streptomyces sp. NPDC059355]|uniref:GNAT family N-acetyltransferase n=1 Tax=Streptomyces sp. NPDC059355 TaxID=3346811 RepID=UPI0036C93CA7